MDGRAHTIIEAGGKAYNLRASFNALATFEENIGPMSMLMNGDKSKMFQGSRGLIWATKNAYGKDSISLAEAGDICEKYIHEKGARQLIKLTQSILNSGGWMDGGEESKNQNPETPEPSED